MMISAEKSIAGRGNSTCKGLVVVRRIWLQLRR
jgi:hypothetical protein